MANIKLDMLFFKRIHFEVVSSKLNNNHSLVKGIDTPKIIIRAKGISIYCSSPIKESRIYFTL